MIIRQHRRGLARDAGFSLIELMVALSIVGVLAAISVPSYVGLRNDVQEAATQADLGSDRTALVAYGIDNNGLFPKKADVDIRSGSMLAGYGWQKSIETSSLEYFPNAARTSWCLQGTSVTGTVFRTSPSRKTLEGTCSSLGESNY